MLANLHRFGKRSSWKDKIRCCYVLVCCRCSTGQDSTNLWWARVDRAAQSPVRGSQGSSALTNGQFPQLIWVCHQLKASQAKRHKLLLLFTSFTNLAFISIIHFHKLLSIFMVSKVIGITIVTMIVIRVNCQSHVASDQSSKCIIPYQGHISKVSANSQSVSKSMWPTPLPERFKGFISF